MCVFPPSVSLVSLCYTLRYSCTDYSAFGHSSVCCIQGMREKDVPNTCSYCIKTKKVKDFLVSDLENEMKRFSRMIGGFRSALVFSSTKPDFCFK